eukprot:11613915-Alexandrium_andersonii.AAC.1
MERGAEDKGHGGEGHADSSGGENNVCNYMRANKAASVHNLIHRAPRARYSICKHVTACTGCPQHAHRDRRAEGSVPTGDAESPPTDAEHATASHRARFTMSKRAGDHREVRSPGTQSGTGRPIRHGTAAARTTPRPRRPRRRRPGRRTAGAG